ncbi:hypothetical protein ACHMWN_08500 [Pedobacter sp. UC225_61]|uniref:hypothetical protein n=1 Tax=Pedobacter sp. UC225_61 TaxID=3374623 RepID=UPI003790B054
MNIKYYIIGIFMLCAFSSYAQTDTGSIAYQKPLFDFDYIKPVFKLSDEQALNKSRFLRFSALSGYRQGVQPVQGFANFSNVQDKKSGTSRIYMHNLSIQDMLTHGQYQSNRVVLEVKDPSRYGYLPKYGPKEEWMRKNAYCFELLLPIGTINDASLLDKELARIFNVEFGRKRILVNTLVLVRTSDKDKIKSTGKGERSYTEEGNFTNINPINGISSLLYRAGLPPMVDETSYKGEVDIELNISDWKDLESVRKALQRYDLDLREEKRMFEMFVIRELDYK